MTQPTKENESPAVGGKQSEKWQTFYEMAWNRRLQMIEEFLKQEKLTSLQAIEKLERFEEIHDLKSNGKELKYYTVPKGLAKEEALPTGRSPLKKINLLETFIPASSYAHPIDMVMAWLDENSVSAIIEIGAGFGQNLIKIFHRYGQPKAKFYAAEYSESGCSLAKILINHSPGMEAEVFHFDHKSPDLSLVKERDKVLILSIHTIEQVQQIPTDYFERLTNNFSQVHGMFFEPFGNQFSTETMPFGEVSKAHAKQAAEREWNMNFLQVLMESEKRQTLKIQNIFKNIWPGDLFNPTSFTYWTKGII